MGQGNIDAAIIGNNLISFFPGMSAREKSDIQDVVTYADLSSSMKFDKQELWSSWIFNYRQRLETHGFKQTSFIVPDSKVLGSPNELGSEIFQIVGSHGSARLADMVKKAFSAARINDVVKVFFQQATVSDKGRFMQLVPCEKTASGDVVILFCGIYLSFSADALHADGKRVILYIRGGRYLFKSDVYASRRDAVSTYLDNRMDQILTHTKL